MSLEHLRPDRLSLDFHEVEKPPQRFNVEILLIEVSPDGYHLPKAYQCPLPEGFNESFEGQIKNKFAKKGSSFYLLGEVEQFNKNSKVLFLTDGTCVSYQHLIVISNQGSSKQSSIKDQEEAFNQALQSLSEAIRVRAKIEVNELLADSTQESLRKLKTMTVKASSSSDDKESLAAIQSGGNPGRVREPQNRLFELHL